MKKLLTIAMLISLTVFADINTNTNLPANIQQLIDTKNWNALITNNYPASVANFLQVEDSDALIDAYIQNKIYFNAYCIAARKSSTNKFIEVCNILVENNFINMENGNTIVVSWSNKFTNEEYRATALAMASKARQILAAECPSNIKTIWLQLLWNFIISAEKQYGIEVLPVQISDSIIENAARTYKKQQLFVVNSANYKNHYAQIYSKYFAALPENSDIAIRKNVSWKKLVYFDWVNEQYGNQFNDILYAKSNADGKMYIALYLNDADKVLDNLQNITQNTLDADILQKIIPILNGQNVDWRQADVIKALRNINAMYTIRLYDDRDTWEPILSKIRAMIDVRQ